ncbi:MAG: hypothetical protein COA49_05875 [Bacteroidetes bacterium]|nr:MAG: hypothetical protein COA49_05875 [Bacteroidota bacterium]
MVSTTNCKLKNFKYVIYALIVLTSFAFNKDAKCFAQQLDIRNLVFEGAGVKGIAYAGVVYELEERGVMSGIEKVGGTSAGAITALMLSLGYTAAELEEIISNTELNEFNDGEYMFIGGIHRVNKRYGWYQRDTFEAWLDQIVSSKTGDKNITFSELHDAGFLDLYTTGTCLNKQKLLVFSNETYPDMRIIDAVLISMSIPFYFEAMFIDEFGKVYSENSSSIPLDIVVDGGIIGNFPIFLFDDSTIDDSGNSIRTPNPSTLGIRMDSSDQVDSQVCSQNNSQSIDLVPLDIRSFEDFVKAFYVFTIENLNRTQLVSSDWDRTVSVSSVGIGPKIRMLSESEKLMLIDSGKLGVSCYFERRL